MTLPAPTIVIFDMDGTTVRHVNPRILHILEKLDDMAFVMVRFTDWVFRRHARGTIFLDVDAQAPPPGRKPKLLVHRALHKMRRKEVEQIVEPCPGIYTVLNLLRNNGIPMGLASNGLGKGYGHDILEKFHLIPYFRATIFREDITNAKPHPEPILLTLQRMNVALSAQDVVWYIGDRHKDIIAVLAAQAHLPCQIVPIACGLNAAIAVLKNHISQEHIIMSYHDMYTRLITLMGEKERVAA